LTRIPSESSCPLGPDPLERAGASSSAEEASDAPAARPDRTGGGTQSGGALLSQLQAAEGSLPSFLGFADRARGVRKVIEARKGDGHVSPKDLVDVVIEAKDFGAITGEERALLVGLLEQDPYLLAPIAREALARFLDLPAPPRRAGERNAPGPAYGSEAFEALLDDETGSRSLPANRTTMLFDGVQSFEARAKLIEGAKDSIHLQTFIFTSDDTGWALARQLADKAKQGVKVRVIYDGLGSNRSGDEIFDFMREAGVQVREYGDPWRKPWDLNQRWHEKHLIVDGKASIVGGMNIANEYALGGSGRRVFSRTGEGENPWRDADMLLEGSSVHDTQLSFLRNWSELGADVEEDELESLFPEPTVFEAGAETRVVQHRPQEDGDEHTMRLYVNAIDSAEHRIVIENAYFVPPAELRDALVRAALRGVEVKVLTNGAGSSDLSVVADAGRYFYDELLAAGVEIYEQQDAVLHAKTAVFDGEFSIVGSVNLNGRSEGLDSESAVAVREGPGGPMDAGNGNVAKSLEARFAEGIEKAKRVTPSDLEDEGQLENLKQWALSLFAWTV
jgi:cardiolipin synthase